MYWRHVSKIITGDAQERPEKSELTFRLPAADADDGETKANNHADDGVSQIKRGVS
jgi:hypothetical protein